MGRRQRTVPNVKWKFRKHGELPAQAFACAFPVKARTIVTSRNSADITDAAARTASCAEGAHAGRIGPITNASKGRRRRYFAIPVI
jgi:hypothetical protein